MTELPDKELRSDRVEERFEAFLASLRRDGYPVTPEVRAAAIGILVDEVARSGRDLSRLKYRLTPLIATDKETQRDVSARVDAFTSLHQQIDQLSETKVEEDIVSNRITTETIQRRYIAAIVLVVIVLLVLLIVGRYSGTDPGSSPELARTPAAVIIGPETSTQLTPPSDSTLQGVSVEIRTFNAKFPGQQAEPRFDLALAVGAVLVPLVLVMVWASLRRWRRAKWLQRAGERSIEPDARLAASYSSQGIPLYQSAGDVANRLGAGGLAEGPGLDVQATIVATARAAGFFSPVFADERLVPNFIVLVERRSPHDHLAAVADLIFDRIEALGLSVHRRYYRDDPRKELEASEVALLGSPYSSAERTTLTRVVIWGSSKGFFNPLTGELNDWENVLDSAFSVTLLATSSSGGSGYRERVLAHSGFFVGEASPEGVAEYSKRVALGEDMVGGLHVHK